MFFFFILPSLALHALINLMFVIDESNVKVLLCYLGMKIPNISADEIEVLIDTLIEYKH